MIPDISSYVPDFQNDAILYGDVCDFETVTSPGEAIRSISFPTLQDPYGEKTQSRYLFHISPVELAQANPGDAITLYPFIPGSAQNATAAAAHRTFFGVFSQSGGSFHLHVPQNVPLKDSAEMAVTVPSPSFSIQDARVTVKERDYDEDLVEFRVRIHQINELAAFLYPSCIHPK